MLRVVLDTNVFVSAVIAKGKPRELLIKGIEKRFRIVTSEFVLRELVDVLRKPRLKTSEDEIHRTVLALIQSSEIVRVTSNFTVVDDDPDDNMILSTAYDGRADIIATGDKLLLGLKNFRNARILSVAAVLKELKAEH